MDFETLTAILADQFDVDADSITEDTDILEDLGCTSMDAVELIVALESAIDIHIPDEAVDSIRTVGELMNYLTEHAEQEEE